MKLFNKYFRTFLSVLMITAVCAACGPAKIEPIKEIKENETAFLVPLEGAAKDAEGNLIQHKFMSVDYLNQAKVAAKRVVIPVRKRVVGKWPKLLGQFKWIPTMKVITVVRTPETREWTQEIETGTKKRDEALAAESSDSIAFRAGSTITAMIMEEDSAKFLYYFSGKPLTIIVDENVRGVVQSVLGEEFGSRTLDMCRSEKSVIFEIAFNAAKKHFKPLGVTIMNLGHVEGLKYDDDDIQTAINDNFKEEMNIIKKRNEKLAQVEINLKEESIATSKKNQALEFAKAAEAQIKQVHLEIAKIEAQAKLNMSVNWNGQLPEKILPSGSNLLLGLD